MPSALFHLDPVVFLTTAGYLGLIILVFCESGILLGIMFPGDSLLFAAGLLSAEGHLHIGLVIVLCAAAAIVGDSVGYWVGAVSGRTLFNRPDSWLFKHSYVERTEAFYEKHGPKAVVLARFVPIVRTLAPFFAGIGSMRYRTFFMYNIIGGIFWVVVVALAGYFLGTALPGTEHYLLPISIGIILVSLVPFAIEYLGARSYSSR